jgi:hypothetical protein
VCDGSVPTQDEAIDYVRSLLAVEASASEPAGAPTKSAKPALQHGESES